jgi:hypothetical protein
VGSLPEGALSTLASGSGRKARNHPALHELTVDPIVAGTGTELEQCITKPFFVFLTVPVVTPGACPAFMLPLRAGGGRGARTRTTLPTASGSKSPRAVVLLARLLRHGRCAAGPGGAPGPELRQREAVRQGRDPFHCASDGVQWKDRC